MTLSTLYYSGPRRSSITTYLQSARRPSTSSTLSSTSITIPRPLQTFVVEVADTFRAQNGDPAMLGPEERAYYSWFLTMKMECPDFLAKTPTQLKLEADENATKGLSLEMLVKRMAEKQMIKIDAAKGQVEVEAKLDSKVNGSGEKEGNEKAVDEEKKDSYRGSLAEKERALQKERCDQGLSFIYTGVEFDDDVTNSSDDEEDEWTSDYAAVGHEHPCTSISAIPSTSLEEREEGHESESQEGDIGLGIQFSNGNAMSISSGDSAQDIMAKFQAMTARFADDGVIDMDDALVTKQGNESTSKGVAEQTCTMAYGLATPPPSPSPKQSARFAVFEQDITDTSTTGQSTSSNNYLTWTPPSSHIQTSPAGQPSVATFALPPREDPVYNEDQLNQIIDQAISRNRMFKSAWTKFYPSTLKGSVRNVCFFTLYRDELPTGEEDWLASLETPLLFVTDPDGQSFGLEQQFPLFQMLKDEEYLAWERDQQCMMDHARHVYFSDVSLRDLETLADSKERTRKEFMIKVWEDEEREKQVFQQADEQERQWEEDRQRFELSSPIPVFENETAGYFEDIDVFGRKTPDFFEGGEEPLFEGGSEEGFDGDDEFEEEVKEVCEKKSADTKHRRSASAPELSAYSLFLTPADDESLDVEGRRLRRTFSASELDRCIRLYDIEEAESAIESTDEDDEDGGCELVTDN